MLRGTECRTHTGRAQLTTSVRRWTILLPLKSTASGKSRLDARPPALGANSHGPTVRDTVEAAAGVNTVLVVVDDRSDSRLFDGMSRCDPRRQASLTLETDASLLPQHEQRAGSVSIAPDLGHPEPEIRPQPGTAPAHQGEPGSPEPPIPRYDAGSCGHIAASSPRDAMPSFRYALDRCTSTVLGVTYSS